MIIALITSTVACCLIQVVTSPTVIRSAMVTLLIVPSRTLATLPIVTLTTTGVLLQATTQTSMIMLPCLKVLPLRKQL